MRAATVGLLVLYAAAPFAAGCERSPPTPEERGAAIGAVSEEAARQRARDIERTTLSPFCPGRTLYDCPSPRAAAWRSDIRRWVAEGESAGAIRARLEQRAPGFQLDSEGPVASAVIGLVVGSMLLLIAFGVRERRRAARRRAADDRDAAATPREQDHDDPELDARLERELAELGDELT